MTSEEYGYPHIPLSRLRELKQRARQEEFYWSKYRIWLHLIRQEIDRLIIQDLQRQLRDAKNYRSTEGYPCPLCTYENGAFVKHCAMHQQIEDLREELEKARAIIIAWEEGDD